MSGATPRDQLHNVENGASLGVRVKADPLQDLVIGKLYEAHGVWRVATLQIIEAWKRKCR